MSFNSDNFQSSFQPLKEVANQSLESGFLAKIKRMWNGHSYIALKKNESGEIIGFEKVAKRGPVADLGQVTKYALDLINSGSLSRTQQKQLLIELRTLNVKVLNLHNHSFSIGSSKSRIMVEQNLMRINAQWQKTMPQSFRFLHPDQIIGLERHLGQKKEVGFSVMQKIESAIARIEKYIVNRMGIAKLVVQTREDLAKRREPIKKRGGSANEVFITPQFVIKAEAPGLLDHTLVKMERFTQDIAHQIGLEDVVLPTVPIKLTTEQAKKLALTAELQKEVEERGEIEVSLAQYAQFSKPELYLTGRKNSNIDLESYQLGALFSGVTQQTDHHQENGGVVTDKATGKSKFLLFDNDICMYDSNALIKSKSEQGQEILGIPIRSFFLAYPQKDQPLTPKVRDIINKWNPKAIMKFCNQQDVNLTSRQKEVFLQRINRVKDVVANNPKATIYDCFKAMYPLLSVYRELYEALNTKPIFTASVEMDACILACSPGGGPCVSITELLQQALASGKITKTKHDEIEAQIKKYQESGDFVDVFNRERN